jgi:transcriptional regulator with XRE-family HTH domain
MSRRTCGGMEFANKLKRLMSRARFSQAQLGARVGVSQNLVGQWCRAEAVPDLREAATLAGIFGVDVNYLADDALDDPPSNPAEAEAVKLVRALELDEAEVVRRLAAGEKWASLPRPAIPPRGTGFTYDVPAPSPSQTTPPPRKASGGGKSRPSGGS